MAAHESPRTTKLYDRTKERLTQDEVKRIKLTRKLYADTSTSVAEICKMLGISRHTLQRYVKE